MKKTISEIRKCVLTNGVQYRRHSKRTGIKRKKKEKYGEDVRRALERIWSICDCICGKRLKPFLKEVIPILEENDEIHQTGTDMDSRGAEGYRQ